VFTVTRTKIKIAAILLLAAIVGIVVMPTTEAQVKPPACESQAEPPKKGDKDLKPNLQGTWSVVANTINGTDLPKELREKSMVVFKDDMMTQKPEVILEGASGQPDQLKLGKDDFPVAFELDLTKNPKYFDVIITANEMKIRAPGIFVIESSPDADTLKICYHPTTRPQDFASKADSGNILLFLKRSKKKAEGAR